MNCVRAVMKIFLGKLLIKTTHFSLSIHCPYFWKIGPNWAVTMKSLYEQQHKSYLQKYCRIFI